MTQPVPLFSGEAMLLSWGDTSSRGKTVTFALHEDDCGESHPFRDLGTGKHGQRFQIVAVPITDDGEPVSPEAATTASASTNTGGRPSKAADDTGASPQNKAGVASGGSKRERTLPEKVGMRCNDTRFQIWASERLDFIPRWGGNAGSDTAAWVRERCGVESRSEILPGTDAAKKWLALETRFLEDTGQMAEVRR